MCPDGFAVMGIRTQVQFAQGSGDDTALNGVELYCMENPQTWILIMDDSQL